MCFNGNFKPKIVSCATEYTGQVWWFTVPQGCSSQPIASRRPRDSAYARVYTRTLSTLFEDQMSSIHIHFP
jgi:hypothetical protein